jgi:DNA-binding response OmpR family regulator
MLTARGQEADKVAGLKSGADDYVTKPFSFLELFARVEAVLRRAQGRVEEEESYEFGNVNVDFRRTQAFKRGKHLSLSPREFKLLRFLIDHRGEVLARERLLNAVWEYDNVPFTRTVDMHIAKLRKKIEDTPQDPNFIVTVHRVGYRFTG